MTDDLGQRQAERDLARHEATHPGCNERYWMERAEAEIAEARKEALALLQGQQNVMDKLNLIEQAVLSMRERAERAEQAAAHFYRCPFCRMGATCVEGWAYVVALKLGESERKHHDD